MQAFSSHRIGISPAERAMASVTHDAFAARLAASLITAPHSELHIPPVQQPPPHLVETPLRAPETPLKQRSPVFDTPTTPLHPPPQPARDHTNLELFPLKLPPSGLPAGSTRSPPVPPLRTPSPPIEASDPPAPGDEPAATPDLLHDPPIDTSSSSSWNLLLSVLLTAATLTFCFALLSALTYMVTPSCALVATLPGSARTLETRPALQSSALFTFFVNTSGLVPRKRERPPRPRDKEGGGRCAES